MFSIKSVPVVQVISVENYRVLFTSRERLMLGLNTRVRLEHKDESGRTRAAFCRLTPDSVRDARDGTWTYVGTLRTALPERLALGSAEHLRRDKRIDCRFRVVSQALPHFTGVSLDISKTGMQIEARGAMPLGKIISITLEPQLSAWQSVTFRARVAWSHQQGPRQYRVGLEFFELEGESAERLAELERYLGARSRAMIPQLVVEGNDLFLLGKLPGR